MHRTASYKTMIVMTIVIIIQAKKINNILYGIDEFLLFVFYANVNGIQNSILSA